MDADSIDLVENMPGIVLAKIPDDEWIDKILRAVDRIPADDPERELKIGVAFEMFRMRFSRER